MAQDTVNGHILPTNGNIDLGSGSKDMKAIIDAVRAMGAVIDNSGNLGSVTTDANVGTAATGATAVEYGNGRQHQTVITVSTALGAIAGGADLGLGKLVYTLPAGAIIVNSAYMSMALTAADGNIDADTPDVGLGTVVASGAVAVLSGTATFENILTGQTAADCSGTATVKTTGAQILAIETGDAHTVYFNVADGWAASGETACLIAGTIVLNWEFMA